MTPESIGLLIAEAQDALESDMNVWLIVDGHDKWLQATKIKHLGEPSPGQLISADLVGISGEWSHLIMHKDKLLGIVFSEKRN